MSSKPGSRRSSWTGTAIYSNDAAMSCSIRHGPGPYASPIRTSCPATGRSPDRCSVLVSDRGLAAVPVWPTACGSAASLSDLRWRGDWPAEILGSDAGPGPSGEGSLCRTPDAGAPGEASPVRDSSTGTVCNPTDTEPAVWLTLADRSSSAQRGHSPAHVNHGDSLSEIGQAVYVHHSTISRIVSAQESKNAQIKI